MMAEQLQLLSETISEERPLDPNVSQRMASDPDTSVWVSASAGTGKTKVLTDRVLRLLLPRMDGRPATKPYKILGLTYTKAAASEMAIRINETLGKWAVLPEEDLQDELAKLYGHKPTSDIVQAARKLFAQVVDTPGGLKIMTIHGFCLHVLSRFPLEAGLPPYLSLIEGARQEQVFKQSCEAVFEKARAEKTSPLNDALYLLAQTADQEKLLTLLKKLTGERVQLQSLLDKNFGIDGLYTKLCEQLDILPDDTIEQKIRDAVQRFSENQDIVHFRDALADSTGKGDQSNFIIISQWLNMDLAARISTFSDFQNIFLKKDGDIRKSLANKSIRVKHPALYESMENVAQDLYAFNETCRKITCAKFTRALLHIGVAVMEYYEQEKKRRAVLDNDDLIIYTKKLLEGNNTPQWVMYKLDQGIDHILVDEAQDTNPEQWIIIEKLAKEFFVGAGQSEEERTIFVVGDEKQSIYSFQRAAPEEFSRMRHFFGELVSQSQKKWQDVSLNISFRSVKSVLASVDAVFANDTMRQGMGEKDISHHSFRIGQAGHIEVWSLFKTEKKPEEEEWSPPVTIKERASGAGQLAEHIANSIKGWIDNGECLPSRDRTIHAGDIMILVKTRKNALFNHISKALKDKGIPVSGTDRMILNEQLVIEDLLAIADFSLLPQDDLTLACVLKSPLIGLSEDDVFEIVYGRDGSVWDALLQKEKAFPEVVTYLKKLCRYASTHAPYSFFSHVLHTQCPADSVSGLKAIQRRLGSDALDPIKELLNEALTFEQNKTPSLQQFVFEQRQSQAEIKRELESHDKQVRIMTVHGSKGLQAPIVILPDTIRTKGAGGGNRPDDRILFPHKSGLKTPLWSPQSNADFSGYKDARTRGNNNQEEEYKRLLYVAMTRAEDRLYIGGCTGLKGASDDSWYFMVSNGLKSHLDAEETPDGGIVLHHTQNPEKSADRVKDKEEIAVRKADIPAWLTRHARKEQEPFYPLMPSRPPSDKFSFETCFPFAEFAEEGNLDANEAIERGLFVHALLEFLPDISQGKRIDAALHYTQNYKGHLPKEIVSQCIDQTIAILNDPSFAMIFGSGSLAEVPVSGVLENGRTVSGRIDRLYIDETAVWIVDYKTNAHVPHNVNDISPSYRFQLETYAQLLKGIYPHRKIHTALLWTSTPQLMQIGTI